jgi:hypothetical protein
VECSVDIASQPRPEDHLTGTEQEGGVPFSFIAVKQEVVSILICIMSGWYSPHIIMSERKGCVRANQYRSLDRGVGAIYM